MLMPLQVSPIYLEILAANMTNEKIGLFQIKNKNKLVENIGVYKNPPLINKVTHE